MIKFLSIIAIMLLPCIAIGDTSTSDPLKNTLERIYTEYLSLAMKPEDADTLYRLDKETSSVVDQIVRKYPLELSKRFWDAKYRKIGVDIGHYSDQLEYSGKLILDLHKVNPNSRYREESLWPSLFGEYQSGSYENNTPRIELIYAYLNEFPHSTYTSIAYGKLAHFYHGLYRFIRYEKNEPRKNECYKQYLSERPIIEQLQQAQDKGIEAYQKALATNPQPREYQNYSAQLNNLRKGTNSKYDPWCDEID